MNENDLEKLIKQGEGRQVEFKEKFDDAAIETLVAFANTHGGKVLIGVANKGVVKGVSIGRETMAEYVNKIKQATYPQLFPNLEAVIVKARTIMVLDIKEFPVKPVAYKNRYYKRVLNSNHILTLEEITELQEQSLNRSFDAQPIELDVAALDPKLVEQFLALIRSKGRYNLQGDWLGDLIKLKLIRGNKPTLAAWLLFGNDEVALHLGRFKSADIIIDDLIIKKPLPEALAEAMIFIKKHINLSFEIGAELQRKEKWQYPLEAIRELLLNCVVHRDYRNSSDSVIKIFDHKISFSNPGKLYGGLTVQDLKRDDYVSSLRNKLLAEMFYLLGEIEKYGTGLVRIRKVLKAFPGLVMRLEEIGNYFKVDLVYHTQKSTQKSTQKIIQLIKANPEITISRLALELGISERAVKKHLSNLKKQKLIRRIGPDKGGKWLGNGG